MKAWQFEIVVEGLLAPHWSDWFDGMTVVPAPDGRTCLVGTVTDQAALFGLLGKVRDLGLMLVSVKSTR